MSESKTFSLLTASENVHDMSTCILEIRCWKPLEKVEVFQRKVKQLLARPRCGIKTKLISVLKQGWVFLMQYTNHLIILIMNEKDVSLRLSKHQ